MTLTGNNRERFLIALEAMQDSVLDMEANAPVKGFILEEFGAMLGLLKSEDRVHHVAFMERFDHWKEVSRRIKIGEVTSVTKRPYGWEYSVTFKA